MGVDGFHTDEELVGDRSMRPTLRLAMDDFDLPIAQSAGTTLLGTRVDAIDDQSGGDSPEELGDVLWAPQELGFRHVTFNSGIPCPSDVGSRLARRADHHEKFRTGTSQLH
jgi:hypothetical protein